MGQGPKRDGAVVGCRNVIRLLGLGVSLGLGLVSLAGRDGLAATSQADARSAAASFPRGAIVRTVLKDLPPEALAGGATLFHEHMSLSTTYQDKLASLLQRPGQPGLQYTRPYFMEDFDLIAGEMRAAMKDGVVCLVDGGHADMGRSIEFLKRLSSQTGMHIVASGGFYTQPFYPPELASKSEDVIADELVRDASRERWGAFGEIGSWDEITSEERKVFRAIGKAHLRTSLPIFTHTANGKSALDQLDTFQSLGVSPQHVVIGHMGGLVDPEAKMHIAIAKRGAYVGFDRLGGRPESDGRQVPMVKAMIDAGYAGKVLLSSDFASETALKTKGGPGYAKTVTVFVPLLRKAGVSEQTIHQITVDNPRRFLAFVPRKTS